MKLEKADALSVGGEYEHLFAHNSTLLLLIWSHKQEPN